MPDQIIESLGKYEIKRPLGRGAMGTVYEGWDPIIARRVAIKTVRLPDHSDDAETQEALTRFRREAQAAGRLTHPNIVGVFDYGETDDVAYIVMEFVDGPPLKTLLDQQERFALVDALRVMQDLLAGLQFSHERGVVHRDIKPANVMLTSAGQAKIADFGIARIESSSMTQAGTLLGTPAYMSPEQFMGQVVDARTDIYSSGVLLYQLLTGERPFEGGMSAIMHKALHTEPPAPSQLSVTAPPAFDAVVRRAMAKRPEERYSSAVAFAEAIRAAAAAPPEPVVSEDEATMMAAPGSVASTSAIPPALDMPPAVPPEPSRGMPLGAIAAAVIVLLLAGGGGAWWFLMRPAATPPISATAVPSPPPAPTPSPSAPPSNQSAAAEQGSVAAPPAPPPAVAPAPTPEPTPPAPPSAAPAPVAQPPGQSSEAPPAPAIALTPPAPPPSPPAAPVNDQQLAMANLGVLRGKVADWAGAQRCALLGGNVGNGGAINLAGFAGNPAIDGLRQGIATFAPPNQIEWHVAGVDGVFCPALDALRPLVPAFGATDVSSLAVQMADGKTRLKDGERVRVHLTMPDFAGRLRVDYLAHDGTVQHLYPQIADPKDNIAADPPRTISASETLNLGNPAWVIGPPYGTDMIIAVASSRALFDKPRPSNAETAGVYLRDLQAAIDAARQRGDHVAGAATTLEALP